MSLPAWLRERVGAPGARGMTGGPSIAHVFGWVLVLLFVVEGVTGAALAAFVAGPSGSVRTFEIDSALAAWARHNLAGDRNATVIEGDAVTSAPRWRGASKVVATFAVEAIPPAWLDALPDGGLLVAPVGRGAGERAPERDQRLVLAAKRGGVATLSDHGAVRYVRNRSR